MRDMTPEDVRDMKMRERAGRAYDMALTNTEAAPKKYTGTDARGRRTTQSDSRVSEGAKAELPAYGFEGMTVGDIMSERKRINQERKGRMEAQNYAKGGKVGSASKRADGCAERGKTKGKII